MSKNIVLIHGWGASVDKFIELKTALERLGWNVFLPKLPGFDLPDPQKPWSVEEYADFVYAKSAKKYKSFVVFGHSFGGRVAFDMTTRHKNISGLILCSTSGITRGNLFKRYALKTASKLGKPLASTRYKKLIYKIAREHDYERLDGTMRETFKKVIEYNFKSRLSSLKVQVLVLWGDKDRMTPVKDADYISKQVKKSKLIIYGDFGHTLPYVHANKLAKDIDSWYTQVK